MNEIFHTYWPAVMVAVILGVGVNGAAAAAEKNWVWWEAEDTARTNFSPPREHSFAPENADQAEKLSGGRWMGMSQARETSPFLEYSVDVPADGTYDLYVRKFWRHGPFRWRFDGGPWVRVGRDAALLDKVELRKHLGAYWVYAGEWNLTEGRHRLRLEMVPDGDTYVGCYDAFLLTSQPFSPRGKRKPNESYPPAPKGWVNFAPGWDTFGEAELDLRFLNEEYAGENGWIQAREDQFVHADTGEPVRFWGVVAGSSIINMRREHIDALARFLAKHGVNLVRIHGGGVYNTSGPDFGAIDEVGLDNYFYTVAAFKKQGIYTLPSIYFQHWVHIGQHPEFPEYKDVDQQRPYAIHFFNAAYQKIHRSWFKALLTRENPYTGMPLAEDPAVFSVEALNEDNLLFWTFSYDRIPPEQMRILERKFGDWLAERYGSIQAALRAWDQLHERDNPGEGRVGFRHLWVMMRERTRRDQDTVRFLSHVERTFYKEFERYLRDELGYKGLIYGSNMKTANARYFEPVERYNNLVLDYTDAHGYFGVPYKERDRGFTLTVGDVFADRSAVRLDGKDPDDLSTREFSVPYLTFTYGGVPAVTSEWTWAGRNSYRAEMMLMAPALSCQAGMDALMHFSVGSTPQWQPGLTGSTTLQSPTDLGQYPAAALLYRQGLVDEAPTAVEINLALDDLYGLKGTPLVGPNATDVNRTAEGATAGTEEQSVDPRVFAVGKVKVNFPGQKQSSLEVAELEDYIDAETGAMHGITGQTHWLPEEGLFKVTAPAAQGATGFFARHGVVELPDLVLDSDLPFGNVTLVSMDGKPLAKSDRMLLQVMSEQRNTNWKATGDPWHKIVSLGEPPIQIRAVRGEIALKREDAAELEVTALDFNGYAREAVGSADRFQLRPDVIYYIIRK